MSAKEKKIYKSRGIVESAFPWIKGISVLGQNYQKNIKSYNGLLLFVCSLIVSKRI